MKDLDTFGNNELALRARNVSGEVVSEMDMVDIAYEHSELDELVRKYAFHEGGHQIEAEVQEALMSLSIDVSQIATQGEGIRVDLIRRAFDHLYSSMNAHAGVARNLRKPSGPIGALLQKTGLRKPEYRGVVIPLDDKYWDKQFLEQFEQEQMVARKPDESTESYLARYTARCLMGFPWAYFSYAV
jgi:hypothetical protein